jgi:hypothetical protein
MTQKTTDYWFTPRRYGYGATPATWQGWAALLALPLVCALVTLALFAWLPPVMAFILFAIFLPAAVFVFIALARTKTDGEWRWSWGDRK